MVYTTYHLVRLGFTSSWFTFLFALVIYSVLYSDFPPLAQYLRSGISGASLILRESTAYIYSGEQSSLNGNSSTLDLDRLKNNSLATCVVAQQYSVTSFASLCFHSYKEKFGACCSMLLRSLYFLKKFLSLKTFVTRNYVSRGMSVV